MTEEPEDENTVDLVMSMDPMNLSTDPKDVEKRRNLDRIIAQERRHRALREQGVKPRKPKSTTKPELSLDIMFAELPKAPPPKPGPSKLLRR